MNRILQQSSLARTTLTGHGTGAHWHYIGYSEKKFKTPSHNNGDGGKMVRPSRKTKVVLVPTQKGGSMGHGRFVAGLPLTDWSDGLRQPRRAVSMSFYSIAFSRYSLRCASWSGLTESAPPLGALLLVWRSSAARPDRGCLHS